MRKNELIKTVFDKVIERDNLTYQQKKALSSILVREVIETYEDFILTEVKANRRVRTELGVYFAKRIRTKPVITDGVKYPQKHRATIGFKASSTLRDLFRFDD